MSAEPVRLSEHLYLVEDTCKVYVVTDGDKALAIDFGSGRVLEHLGRLGVTSLEWVLHSHYHRDQCQGDAHAVAAGAKLAVPQAERKFFEQAGQLWASGGIPSGFVQTGGFALRQSVPVSQDLVPGEAFTWRGYRFEVLATPCQTRDSLTLVTEVDGRRVAFTGDLIARPGQVWDFGQLEWSYLQYEGLQALPASCDVVRQSKPDLLCPSHGEVMHRPEVALTELALHAQRVADLVSRQTIGRWNWQDLVRVSAHLLKDAGTTSYFILADDGHAVVFDLGEFKPELFQGLRQRYGVTAIDAVVVSHFHLDHTEGIPQLVQEFGSEVWALDVEADILEHPEKYAMSFSTKLRLRPDRLFHDGEQLAWRGYTFTFLHLPAHTEYHLGMLATVDGKPTMFTADAIGHTDGNDLSCSFVCRNRISLESGALGTARQVYRWAPYVICPAHSDPYVSDTELRRRYLDWAASAKDAISGLIAQPHPAMGFDPYWVRIEPYLIRLQPGAREGAAASSVAPRSTVECSLVVQNYFPVPAEFKADLRVPEGLVASPDRLEGSVPAGAERRFSFSLQAGGKRGSGRQPIAADVTFAGRRWGELTEALVEVGE